ncbi:MAG: hypothetical protein ACKVT2_06135 [Saprospiraceae bacterium]
MTSKDFWYCTRLELTRETGAVRYSRFFREAAKALFPARFNNNPPKLPESEFIFVIITENHLKHFQPVAKELWRQNRSFSIVFTNEALFKKYAPEWPGISFSIQSWIGQRQYFQAVLFQSALLLSNIFTPSQKRSVIIRFAKPACLIHQTMLRLLSGTSLKVILFKAEAYQANAVLLACKQVKTPSFAIQHGLIGDTDQITDLAVDRYLVWSEFFKKRLEDRQANCAVQITGNAAYDGVFQAVAESKAPLLQNNPIKLLVLPSAGFSHTPIHQVYSLLEASLHFARNNPAARISVKPHPADHTENTQRFLKPYLPSCSNLQLLDRLDEIPFEQHHLVAINNSGAGMEACIWARPLVVFSTNWEDVQVKQYIDYGVAEYADTQKAFSDKILKINNQYVHYQERCRAFSKEQLAFPGQAAKKIVEVLSC